MELPAFVFTNTCRNRKRRYEGEKRDRLIFEKIHEVPLMELCDFGQRFPTQKK